MTSLSAQLNHSELIELCRQFAGQESAFSVLDQVVNFDDTPEAKNHSAPIIEAPRPEKLSKRPFKETAETEATDLSIHSDFKNLDSKKPGDKGDKDKELTALEPDVPIEDRIRAVLQDRLDLRGDSRQWSSDGSTSLPVHLPLIPRGQMRGLIGGLHTTKEQTRRLDIGALVKGLAGRKPLRKLPRLMRPGFGGQIAVIPDMGIGMRIFEPDYIRFIARLKRLVGEDRVITKVDRQPLEISETGALPRPGVLPQGCTVLILSDLQGFAQRHGYPHTSWNGWVRFAHELDAKNCTALIFSPGDVNNRVPLPGFGDLFIGRRPKIGRIVPWDDSLSPQRMASFARGRLLARAIDGRPQADRGFDLMLRLLTLVQDVDKYTLRAIRLVLQDPDRLWAALLTMKTPPKRPEFAPARGHLGAWSEHAIWCSDVITRRDATGHMPRNRGIYASQENLRSRPKDWSDIAGFAQEALKCIRAGRGFDQLLGDAVRWFETEYREDRPSQEDREKLQALLDDLVALDGDDLRVNHLAASYVAAADRVVEQEETRYLTFTKSGNRLRIGQNTKGADFRISLPIGTDLSKGRAEIWRKKVSSSTQGPVETVPLWPLSGQATLRLSDPENAFTTLETVIVRFPDWARVFTLSTQNEKPEPCFILDLTDSDSRSGPLRFDGAELVSGTLQFEPIGLMQIGEAAPEVDPETALPSNGARLSGDQNLRHSSERIVAVQPDRRSAEVSAFCIPTTLGDGAKLSARTQEGHLAILAPRALIVAHPMTKDDPAELTSQVWTTEFLFPNATSLAVSKAGALLGNSPSGARSNRKSFGLHFLPRREGPSSPPESVSLQIGINPKALALRSDGLVAVRSNTALHIYEPLERFAVSRDQTDYRSLAAEMGTASEEQPKFLPLRADPFRDFSQHWLPSEDSEWYALIEALTSPGSELANTAFHALRYWQNDYHPSQLQKALGISGEAAKLFAAVLAGDPKNLDAVTTPKNINSALPGSGLTPLLLACLSLQPIAMVRKLVGLGADVNQRDQQGRFALYSACFADDRGETFSFLLDSGADPSFEFEINGIKEGILPAVPQIFANTAQDIPALIKELIRRGAKSDSVFAASSQSLLIGAALNSDEATFDFALRLDRRVDYMCKDGWTALRIASFFGCRHHVAALIGQRAPLDQANPDEPTAFELAVQCLHPVVVGLLLKAGAEPFPIGDGRRNSGAIIFLRDLNNEGTKDLTDTEKTARIREIATHMARANVDLDRPKDWEGHSHMALILDAYADAGHPATMTKTAQVILNRDCTLSLPDLISYRIDPNGQVEHGISILHLLAAAKHIEKRTELMATLIEKGADPAIPDAQGNTPLHYAHALGRVDAREFLLAHDPTLADVARLDGKVPAQLVDGPAGSTAKAPGWRERMVLSYALAKTTSKRAEFEPTHLSMGHGRDIPVPLPDKIQFWHLVRVDQSALPYRQTRTIRQSWWRRDDGILGISVELRDIDDAPIFELNGRSPEIHAMNATAAPQLKTEAEAIAYLKFFCHAVHGEEGAFSIIDTVDAIPLFVPEKMREKVTNEWIAPNFVKDGAKGWKGNAIVKYSTAAFYADFRIQPGGMVEMIDDTPIAAWDETDHPIFKNDGLIFYYEAAEDPEGPPVS